MTITEKLHLAEEIERTNRERIRKHRTKKLHAEMIRSGKFEEAHLVLRFLRNGMVRLGLDDADWDVQCELEQIGYKTHSSRNGSTATVYLV